MLEMAAAGKTLAQFLAYCEESFNVPAGKKPEDYWKQRRNDVLKPYKDDLKMAEESEDADMIEVCEEELAKFHFASSCGRGRKKSAEKVEHKKSVQDKLREKLELKKAEKAAAAAAKLLKDAAELAPITPKNEFTITPSSNPDAFLPMLNAK